MPTQLELLLAQLGGLPPPAPSKPIPYAPVGAPTFPTALGTLPPDIAPTAPPGPQDTGFINRYAGPAPTAPQPLSRGQRIANALQGFSAGLQGRGGEYLAQLQEPQREYQRQLERYQGRRTEAIQLDERRREREQDAATRRAESQSEREFQQYIRSRGVSDSQAIEQLRFAHELQRDAIKLNAERVEQERRDKIAQQRDSRQIEERYFTATKNRALSKELGQYWAGVKESLSPAAAALDRKLQGIGDVRMNRAVGIGGGGGQNTKAEKARLAFESAKQGVIDAVARGDQTGERQLRKRMTSAFNFLSRFPGVFVQGYAASGMWPYVYYRNGQTPGQTAQPAQNDDPLGVGLK